MRKYIKQIDSKNFVYPNNTVPEYDVEIIHDINNNSVSGTVTNFSATTVSYTGITIQFDYTWSLNGAEPFISQASDLNLFSVHAMEPSRTYFKPWRLIDFESSSNTALTSTGSTFSFTMLPSDFEIAGFTNGTYVIDVRMIGHRSIFPICASFVVSTITPPTPTPTPTPTVTPTNVTPTPTPTPSATPGGNDYTSGATINVTDTGYIKYTSSTGQTYQFINTLGTVTLTACLDCATIIPGFPFADLAEFTITNCGSSCGGAPSPSPTPTPTSGNDGYYIMTDCQTFETAYSQQLPYGTYNSGDRVEGSYGYFYVITGFTPSTPATTFFITATGQSGCP
jgi:hypothetical protein